MRVPISLAVVLLAFAPGWALAEAPWGRFLDTRSKEELFFLKGNDSRQLHPRVIYRAKGKPHQELRLDGDLEAGVVTVRFRESEKEYELTFDDTKKSVNCRNPDGTTQRFVRQADDGLPSLARPMSQTGFLGAVWGFGPDSVWAVGAGGTILHWNGSAWWLPTDHLNAVWGSAPDDVWAVGEDAIVHWDGSGWTRMLVDERSPAARGLWGSGPKDVWAAGYHKIRHWDGTAWSVVAEPEASLRGIWGSGPNDVWVVNESDGVVLRWNGKTWSSMWTGAPKGLTAIWGSGPDDVWVVGYEGSLIHWDGTQWAASTSGTRQPFYAVWGSSPVDVWAVGASGTILHWNGKDWASQMSRTTKGLQGIWGSGPSDVWAVGLDGTVLHWNGNAWSPNKGSKANARRSGHDEPNPNLKKLYTALGRPGWGFTVPSRHESLDRFTLCPDGRALIDSEDGETKKRTWRHLGDAEVAVGDPSAGGGGDWQFNLLRLLRDEGHEIPQFTEQLGAGASSAFFTAADGAGPERCRSRD